MHRNRWITAVLLIGVLALGLTNVATAAKSKKLKGADLYKEYCKPCHLPESLNGEYTPMTLIQDQWETFFEEKYEPAHKTVVDEKHDGKTVTDAISEETLKVLKKWVVDHAADSEHPMTCG